MVVVGFVDVVRQLVQKEQVYDISVDYPNLNIALYTQTLHEKEW